MRRFRKIPALLCCCLCGCVAQGSYQEQHSVHFSASGSSISETSSGSYRHSGMPAVSGAVAVQGPRGSAVIHSAGQAYSGQIHPGQSYYPAPYPADHYRSYSDGNTTIRRGTVHPGACTQNVRRNGRIYSRRIPCPY